VVFAEEVSVTVRTLWLGLWLQPFFLKVPLASTIAPSLAIVFPTDQWNSSRTWFENAERKSQT
jgi:hypothetical protein